MSVAVSSTSVGSRSLLLSLPLELLDLIVLFCAETAERDGFPSERQAARGNHVRLCKRLKTLGHIRLVCRRLSERASLQLWAKLSNVTSPNLNRSFSGNHMLPVGLRCNIRELEIIVKKSQVSGHGYAEEQYLQNWRGVLRICHSLRKVHLHDACTGEMSTLFSFDWVNSVPNLEEVVFSLPQRHEEMAKPVEYLAPCWKAPKLKVFVLENVHILGPQSNKMSWGASSDELAAVDFLSFRNCLLDARVPSALIEARKVLAAEVRCTELDCVISRKAPIRDDLLLDALAPTVTELIYYTQCDPHSLLSPSSNLTWAESLARFSHPLPNLSSFANLKSLTLDLNNLYYDFAYFPSPRPKLEDKEFPWSASHFASLRSNRLPNKFPGALPDSVTELTIEFQTYSFDIETPSSRIARWIEDHLIGKSVSLLPLGLQTLRLVALQCCDDWDNCNKQLCDLTLVDSWEWAMSRDDVTQPKMEDWAPEHRVTVFDSASGGYLFGRTGQDADGDEEDSSEMSDDEIIDDNASMKDETVEDSQDEKNLEVEVEEPEQDTVQDTGEESGTEDDVRSVSKSDASSTSDKEYACRVILSKEEHLAHLAAEARLRLVLVNGTPSQPMGRFFASPVQCQRHKHY